MPFVLSKLLWPLLAPGNLLVLMLGAGRRRGPCPRRVRIGLRLVRVAAIELIALTVLPVGAWLIAPLEARFPEIDPPDRVDGIVVLGGSVDPRRTAGHRQPLLAESPGRLTEMIHLMRLYPQAR